MEQLNLMSPKLNESASQSLICEVVRNPGSQVSFKLDKSGSDMQELSHISDSQSFTQRTSQEELSQVTTINKSDSRDLFSQVTSLSESHVSDSPSFTQRTSQEFSQITTFSKSDSLDIFSQVTAKSEGSQVTRKSESQDFIDVKLWEKKDELLVKIQRCLFFFQHSLLDFPRPTLYIAGFEKCSALELGFYTPYRFACVFTVLRDIYKMLITNTTRTKRGLFYDNKQLFETQSTLDLTLKHVCALLYEQRKDLRIMSTGKGLVIGDLTFTMRDGSEVTSLLPVGIPANTDDIGVLRSTAKFILIVEKDTIFQKLVSENFHYFYEPCIIVTAKGYPDYATRHFIIKLLEQLNLPLFALMDGDPHGIEIYLTYKYGTSKVSDVNAEMCKLDSVRWVGLFPSEISGLPLNDSHYIKLTNNETSKINSMLRRKVVYDDVFLRHQLEKLLEVGYKVALESLMSLEENYLTATYLKVKFIKLMKNLLR